MLTPDQRRREYEKLSGNILLGKLGAGIGQDGFVHQNSKRHAVKFFDRPDRFQRELEVYTRLRDRNIDQVGGHNVPRLIRSIESIHVIEMTIVSRPFVLDFAGAKLPSEVPDFSDDVMEDHYAHLKELFGKKWTDALRVAELFRIATGYTLLDIHPGNISFRDSESSIS